MSKSKPILFNAAMVQAILDGRKTQTRRAMEVAANNRFRTGSHTVMNITDPRATEYAPYKKGEKLWVRESTEVDRETHCAVELSRYCADGEPVLHSANEDDKHNGAVAHWWHSKDICPSIHMPKWASRITLEITDVRVERLQDISEEDAIAEGFCARSFCSGNLIAPASTFFMRTWDQIYGENSISKNPWVWVIEFKRVE